MSDKPPITGPSLFGSLFGAFADPQSPEGKEHLQRMKEAARWLAAWEAAEASNEKGWVN